MSKRSMRQAIDAKCKDCIYDSAEPGTWRQQTEECTIRDCSLWPYRPLRDGVTYAEMGLREAGSQEKP